MQLQYPSKAGKFHELFVSAALCESSHPLFNQPVAFSSKGSRRFQIVQCHSFVISRDLQGQPFLTGGCGATLLAAERLIGDDTGAQYRL
jgi:hypothetical protein